MAIAADNHADTFENIISDFGGDGCQYRCEVNPRSVGVVNRWTVITTLLFIIMIMRAT